MTDPLLRLEPQRVSVEPGGQARLTVTIHNPGTIVEGYDLDVVSESPMAWVEIVPAFVSIYPQQEQTAVVVFTPPTRPGTPGGTVAFGVRARSRVDSSSSAVVEGDLDIGRVFGLQAKLTPVTSTGRWRGRHSIEITNWGNAPARLSLKASDADQALGFLLHPEVVDVPLGGSTTARLKVRTRRPTLRGTVRRLPFQVVGDPDSAQPIAGAVSPVSDPRRPVVDGAFSQKPILSRGVVAAAVAAVVVAAVVVTAVVLSRPSGTSDHSDLGVPLAPTNLAAASPETSTVTLTWTGVSQIEKYTLEYLDPTDQTRVFRGEDVSADLNEFKPELKPETRYCFALVAVRGEFASPASNVVCTRTLKPGVTSTTSTTATSPVETTTVTTSVSPPPSGIATGADGQVTSFPADAWVAVVEAIPDLAGDAQQTATTDAQRLVAEGIPAYFLHSPDFPALTSVIPNAAWVVVIGPAGSQADADNQCTAAKADFPQACFLSLQVMTTPPTGPSTSVPTT